MKAPVELALFGVFRPRSTSPGFAIPVFGDSSDLWVQEVGNSGQVVRFVRCDVQAAQLLSAPMKIESEPWIQHVGEQPIYAFQMPDERVEVGTREMLTEPLRIAAPQLAAYSFVSLDAAEFLGDREREREAREACSDLLRPRSVEARIKFTLPQGKSLYPKDLPIDLRYLGRKLEVDAEIDRTMPPEFRPATSTSSGLSVPATASNVATTAQGRTARSASSPEYIVSGIKQHKLAAATALLVLIIGGIGLSAYLLARNSGVAIESIAVLPFVNASGDANTEYLSDGISETLINSLSRVQKLRVVAGSTAFRYKGKEIDPQAVGRDLNVRAVLMGRVRQTGDTLNIQVDLIDTRTGAQLWGEEYDRKVSDVLAVKQDIAREVTEKLRLRLTGEQQKEMTNRDATNTEAYQFYLKGRYYWNKRTAEGINKAIEQFQRAVDKDPNYALAYVGLADCYLILEQYVGAPASELYPKAKAYVQRALQLDSSLAEAHASLGLINDSLWLWDEAEREYKRAIELNPNYPTAHHWYSIHFEYLGRFDEQMVELKLAQQLDPLSLIISADLEQLYLTLGDLNSALEQCRKTIQLDPFYPSGHADLGSVYLKQGRDAEAITEFQKAVELSGRSSDMLSSLGAGYAIAGKHAEALAVVKELEEKYAEHEAIGQNLARVYANLGDKDQAFAWLEKDFQARSGVLGRIRALTELEPLRGDPRFADLRRRTGLEP